MLQEIQTMTTAAQSEGLMLRLWRKEASVGDQKEKTLQEQISGEGHKQRKSAKGENLPGAEDHACMQTGSTEHTLEHTLSHNPVSAASRFALDPWPGHFWVGASFFLV